MKVKTKYEIVAIESTEFTVDVSLLTDTDEMFFNATEMALSKGKKPNDWLKTGPAKEYINVVSRCEQVPYDSLVIIKQGGRHQGTWLHKKLVLPFARWCSVEFEYRLDCWIRSRIEEERIKKSNRLESKTGFLPLTNELVKSHDEIKPYHFSNECDMLNKIATGLTAKQIKNTRGVNNVRDALSASEIKKLNDLQKHDTTLIALGFDYQQRKELLTKYSAA